MQPTFQEKDTVISVHKKVTKLKKGNICICRDPRTKRVLIKRIKEIKDNKYFVVGDNKDESTDSRDFGWLDKENMIGKVIYPKM
jgi:nickel-type superoxide dismutase maturation protease